LGGAASRFWTELEEEWLSNETREHYARRGAVRRAKFAVVGAHTLAGRDRTAWLAFLNTVRTERFDEVLALKPLLPAIGKAA
jgi:hypothetical protein